MPKIPSFGVNFMVMVVPQTQRGNQSYAVDKKLNIANF